MKKTIKLVAVVMVIAMLALSLVACAKTLKGTYTGSVTALGIETTYTYTFDGDEYTLTTYVSGYQFGDPETGTYKIVEDPEKEDAELIVFTPTGSEEGNSKSFEEGTVGGKKVIIINGVTYTKAE